MAGTQFFILQELDDQLDQLREEQHLASLLSDERTAHLDTESARARRQAHEIEAQIKAREEQRAETAATLRGELLTHYERLRKKLKSRPWVVRLNGSTCQACNMTLPSKLLGDAQRTGDPIACPSCARLLVWKPALAGGKSQSG